MLLQNGTRFMGDWINNELARSYRRATKAGEARLATQPLASRAYYDAHKARLVVELTNGVILIMPPKLLQGLKGATAAQITKVEINANGYRSALGSARRGSRCG